MKYILSLMLLLTLPQLLWAKPAKSQIIYQQAVNAYQKQDFKTAFTLLKPLAEQGDSVAQHNLAVLYQDGLGIEKNPKRALYWYRQAGKNGEIEAQFMAGLMYSQGEGVAQNYQKAFYWYQQAALAGHDEAMNNLAARYATGTGTTKNLQQAKIWYEKAAKLGNKNAAIMLKQLNTIQ